MLNSVFNLKYFRQKKDFPVQTHQILMLSSYALWKAIFYNNNSYCQNFLYTEVSKKKAKLALPSVFLIR